MQKVTLAAMVLAAATTSVVPPSVVADAPAIHVGSPDYSGEGERQDERYLSQLTSS